MSKNFADVTELTGYRVTKEQLQRMYTRYRFASEFCKNKDVLEVACGSGQGIGYIARIAKRVIGGDIDEENLRLAVEYYKGRENIEFKLMDAHQLPVDDNSFDVVILYEAIYYLVSPEKFIAETYRVLRNEGVLLICTANKDCVDFNPSQYSYRYFSVPELYSLLRERGFDVELFADCPACYGSYRDKIISILKQVGVKLQLIPKTMKRKEKIKRLLFGKLIPLHHEIEDEMCDYTPPVSISEDTINKDYKVIYAVGYVQ